MNRFLASALLLGSASLPAHAYYPCGCPCVPAYNAIDFSAIDFSSGMPHCLSPFFAQFTPGGCSPHDLYYAYSMGPYQPQFNQFGVFSYPIPMPGPYGGLGCACCPKPPCFSPAFPQQPFAPPVAGPAFAPPVAGPGFAPPPAPGGPLAPGRFAPVYGPKSGPPVIDAVDPFTVGNRERDVARERHEVATPSEQKASEFDLPRVSPINNGPLNISQDPLDMMPPVPPDANGSNQGTRTGTPTTPNSIMLPAPRFVPNRGNV